MILTPFLPRKSRENCGTAAVIFWKKINLLTDYKFYPLLENENESNKKEELVRSFFLLKKRDSGPIKRRIFALKNLNFCFSEKKKLLHQ
jgi:hypothetical protein